MPSKLYCWRCQMVLPMLTDAEWAQVSVHLDNQVAQIKQYRALHQCSLAEANMKFGQRALAAYFAITGFEEHNASALYHHRLALYGPPCTQPQARHCAGCGATRE